MLPDDLPAAQYRILGEADLSLVLSSPGDHHAEKSTPIGPAP
jgi:hypothetical protein